MNEMYLKRMKEQLSESYDAYIKSLSEPETHGLILNTKKCKVLPGLTKINDYTYSYTDADTFNGKLVYHHLGAYYISEPSSMAVIPKLDIKESDKVLDLCAAPGGKSIQALMYLDEQKGGFLVANEIVVKRVKILSSNIERMGFNNVLITSNDAKTISEKFPNTFDKLIVDAPCSGEGMFRKDMEARDMWSENLVYECAKRQKEIVMYAVNTLKPGGLMSYSTCTFSKEEDEDIVEYIKTLGFTLILEEKIYPHMSRGEGQYIAILKKNI